MKVFGLKGREKRKGNGKQDLLPEVLCAVLVRELLWLEARMDDQALFEGIVVFSDEDGPGKKMKRVSVFSNNLSNMNPFNRPIEYNQVYVFCHENCK